ncbi:MAG: MBL fold metallo-hydrolase [Oscillospiraceae bacterium]|nr:MBL fold metallo-hydrolase [Oscillospiraceae bacterium]
MLVKTLPVGYLETNCYVLCDEASKQCAVIDPGDEPDVIAAYVRDSGLRCAAILLTHCHFDHIGALGALLRDLPATVYLGEKDTKVQIGSSPGFFRPPENSVFCSEDDVIEVGGLKIKVIETPGHTPGGLTFVCLNALFTGDTLFCSSCGRTDFPGGDMDTLMRSLKKLHDLPGDFEVYPGHAESTNLERERKTNYYMRYACEE